MNRTMPKPKIIDDSKCVWITGLDGTCYRMPLNKPEAAHDIWSVQWGPEECKKLEEAREDRVEDLRFDRTTIVAVLDILNKWLERKIDTAPHNEPQAIVNAVLSYSHAYNTLTDQADLLDEEIANLIGDNRA